MGFIVTTLADRPDLVDAVEAMDTGWPEFMLVMAMRDNARRLGYRDLVAPVRPSIKAEHPTMPMADYIARFRADGSPVDPWLRVHVRLGGVVVKVCPASMAIASSLRDWRAWTDLPFDVTGNVIVPGALAPVHVSVEHDLAVYVEPNVWVHHRSDAATAAD